jgi:putative flippase GtrA
LRNARSNENRDAAEQPFIANRFLRFLIAGSAAAIANFGSRFFFSWTMDFEYAVIAAHVVGMVVAFTTFRTFVFKSSGRRLEYEGLTFIAGIRGRCAKHKDFDPSEG